LALQDLFDNKVIPMHIKFIDVIKVIFGISILIIIIITTTSPLLHHSQFVDAVGQQQDNITDRIYHSNATGATIIFHDHSITSKTSNMTGTNNTGVTGFDTENSMRNMTNPMFLMKKNPLTNLSNPLANMTNPLRR
jgi:hypothetical protein